MTARLFGLMASLFAMGTLAWFAVVLWGEASDWTAARTDAAAQAFRIFGVVTLLALGARLLCQRLASADEAANR